MTISKGAEIFMAISNLCDKGFKISFEEDMGCGSLTIWYEKDGAKNHTHVGYPGVSKTELLGNLYDHFVEHKGLSFAVPIGAP